MGAAKLLTKLIDRDLGYNKIKAELLKLESGSATVGIHEGAGEYDGGEHIAQVAFWNEYGTINAPARSFMRSTFDRKRAAIEALKAGAVLDIYERKGTAEQAYKKIGFAAAEFVKNTIKSDVPPPNATATLARKHRSTTLIDSGTMLRAVDFEVKV